MTDTSEGEIPDLSIELPVFIRVKEHYMRTRTDLKGKGNSTKKL